MKTDCTGSLRMLLPPYEEESSPSREESGDYAELQKGRQAQRVSWAAVQGAVGVHFLVPSPGGSPSSRTDQVWIEEVLAKSKNPDKGTTLFILWQTPVWMDYWFANKVRVVEKT